METLAEIYKRHCVTGPDVGHGDKGGTHSYIPEYERLLEPYRMGCVLMEIGLAHGLSLEMWVEYMPFSIIYGVDISIVFDRKKPIFAGVLFIEADATKPEFLTALPDPDRKFDVVIDDGSHVTSDQVKTFNMLKPKMASGGIYIIEDILNLEAARPELERLHPNCEIIDLRHVKGRFDDVLVVYRF